jgi:hypothetical protein
MTGKVVNGPIMFFFVFLLLLFPSSETSSSDCSKSDCDGRYALLSVDMRPRLCKAALEVLRALADALWAWKSRSSAA